MDIVLDNWSAWHEYVFLTVDAVLAALLYSVYRRRDQIIKNIMVIGKNYDPADDKLLFNLRGV
jgi:hypothetical protein